MVLGGKQEYAEPNASPGRGNEPGRTIGRSAHNTAWREGRRVQPRARLLDRAAPWFLRLLSSWHPPRHRRQCCREGNISARPTTPTLTMPLQAIYTRPSSVASVLRRTPSAERVEACESFRLETEHS